MISQILGEIYWEKPEELRLLLLHMSPDIVRRVGDVEEEIVGFIAGAYLIAISKTMDIENITEGWNVNFD